SGQRAPADCACAATVERSASNTATTTRATARSPLAWAAIQATRMPMPTGSRDALRLAQALDKRRAQQESPCQLGVFRRAAQLVVVLSAHGRVLLGQQPLVANGLRLRVLHGDVAALALVAVKQVVARFSTQDLGQLLGQV